MDGSSRGGSIKGGFLTKRERKGIFGNEVNKDSGLENTKPLNVIKEVYGGG